MNAIGLLWRKLVKWYSSASNLIDRSTSKLVYIFLNVFKCLQLTTQSIIISLLTKSLSLQFSIWCSNDCYSGCIEPYTCMTIKIGKPLSCQNIGDTTCQCMKSKLNIFSTLTPLVEYFKKNKI